MTSFMTSDDIRTELFPVASLAATSSPSCIAGSIAVLVTIWWSCLGDPAVADTMLAVFTVLTVILFKVWSPYCRGEGWCQGWLLTYRPDGLGRSRTLARWLSHWYRGDYACWYRHSCGWRFCRGSYRGDGWWHLLTKTSSCITPSLLTCSDQCITIWSDARSRSVEDGLDLLILWASTKCWAMCTTAVVTLFNFFFSDNLHTCAVQRMMGKCRPSYNNVQLYAWSPDIYNNVSSEVCIASQ